MLLLPASQFGISGPGTTLATFTDWPRVANTLALDLAFNPSNTFNDVSLFWNSALAANLSIPVSALDLDAGVFYHAHLQLDATNGGAFATMVLTQNGRPPGAPTTVFSNYFVPGVTLGNTRLEFTARNGGLMSRVDLGNVVANAQALAPLLLAPGESIVVVHNEAAFISRYGTNARIAGEFSGTLANEGDRLTLFGPLGEPILDFSYDPAWYPITDGGGFSLVAANPAAPPGAWGLPQNWRPSSELDGSPGTADPPPPAAILSVRVANQILALSWPAASGTFKVYSTTAFDPPVQWFSVTNPAILLDGRWNVLLPLTTRASFYRLAP
jgi:hypothetical protein